MPYFSVRSAEQLAAMSGYSLPLAAGPNRWAAASILSAALHISAVVLIVAAIDARPQGAATHADGEIGIVLGNEDSGSAPAGRGSTPPAAAPLAAVEPAAEPAPAATQVAAAPAPAPVDAPRIAQALAPQGDGVGGGGAGGGNYGPPGDGQASVRVFGVEGKGARFVYVFDRSSSMDGAPLAAAKQQLIQSLESLASVHQFHIIFFNQQLRHFDLGGGARRIAFASDRNKKLAARFVGGITADGGTDRLPALRAALQMHPDVVFFLTDADDPMPASELQEIAELNQRAGVVIATIEFGRGPAKQKRNFLTELARMSGGQYGYVDTTQLAK